jgi:hypothetical protein
MKRFLGIAIIWLCCSPALAQSVDAEGNALLRPRIAVTESVRDAGLHLHVLEEGYEFYLNQANLSKADDFLESFVAYGRYQSAKTGLSPEQLLVIGGGNANTWKALVEQAATLVGRPRGKSESNDNDDEITDCHKSSNGDFDCITRK